MSSSGTVKSVSGNQLVVSANGKDMTFAIDSTTKFIGKGLSTKSAQPMAHRCGAERQGSCPYHDMGGTMHAASVRITE